jgi:ATP-binding cassette subfamily B protein
VATAADLPAAPARSPLPTAWRAVLDDLVDAGSPVVGWAWSNIDASQKFCPTLLILTERSFIACAGTPASPILSHWPLHEIAALTTNDRAGLGTIEALGTDRRLAIWHYTLDLGPAVLLLIEAFDAASSGERVDSQEESVLPPEAESTVSPPTTKALWRLARFARPHARAIAAGFLLSFLAMVAGLIPPYLTMPLLDDILIPYQTAAAAARATGTPIPPEANFSLATAALYLAGLLAAAVAAWILGWVQGVLLAWVSERIAADLRNASYSHLQRLSLEYFGGKRTGDLMSRISTDSDRLCQFLSDGVVDFAADCFLIVGTAIVLVWIDPWLALVSLVPFPIISWLMYVSRDRLQSGFQSGGRAWAHMTSVLADTIPGIRVVKAFAQESREIERFAQANREVLAANDRVNRVWTFFWPMIIFLNQLGILVVWGYGIYRVHEQLITVGVLTAFLAYIARFYGRLESMSRMVNSSQRAAASAQRIFEILDRVSTVPEPVRPLPLDDFQGRVELRGVGFRYWNRKVLDGVSLKIAAGEMIGLVGQTGAGKSTLINLVCRFFDVAEGAIYADGVDIRSFKVEDWRKNVGIVLQDPFLFFGTIAENIAYGKPGATRDEIIAAAKAARAHEFILQLPDGYDSLVGERGQSLSGGERQRISIARALLINPRLLILDEATSAVDTETERQIQEALQNLVKNRTTIAIAHRLSTLRRANRIVVLDHGKIVEAGSHEELLRLEGGHYAKLVEAQQALTKDIGW